MVKYVFKEITTIKNAAKADPQKIGEALEKIAAKAGGHLTPAATVEEAKNPRHILHNHFDWDDAVAASSWRLDQARTLIRSVQIEDDTAESGHAPAFISISEKGGTSYRSLETVRLDADLQSKVLAAASRDLEAWQNRYRALQDVCVVIREAQDILRRKRERAQGKQDHATV